MEYDFETGYETGYEMRVTENDTRNSAVLDRISRFNVQTIEDVSYQ
jgi:hypothetical protein